MKVTEYVMSNARSWLFLAAVACLLVVAGSPAAVSAGSGDVRQAPCASRTVSGVLGREGGLLSLRGYDESAKAVAAIVGAKGYTIRLMHTAGQGGYVAYMGSECLGIDGGLMAKG